MATIGISDHALVRWLQRSGAMDMERLRALLAASLDRASAAAQRLDSEEYLILADGLVFVVREGTVITVLPERQRHAHIHNRLKRLREAERAGASGQAGQ